MDSNDRDRVGEARDELHRMLNEVRLLSNAAGPLVFSRPSRQQETVAVESRGDAQRPSPAASLHRKSSCGASSGPEAARRRGRLCVGAKIPLVGPAERLFVDVAAL